MDRIKILEAIDLFEQGQVLPLFRHKLTDAEQGIYFKTVMHDPFVRRLIVDVSCKLVRLKFMVAWDTHSCNCFARALVALRWS